MTAVDSEQVVVEKDIVFGRGGARDLLCDVYRPPESVVKHTAIIHIHGGGFRGGSKEGARTAARLAAAGYVCVSTSYRLMNEAKWPAQIQDVKAVIRWTRANADRLGFDPDKLVVLGYSAGAHLAIVAAGSGSIESFEDNGGAAGVSAEVAACVAFYPPASRERSPEGVEDGLMGPGRSDDDYRGVSPIEYVRAGFPPAILLHGTADTTIPVDESVRLYTAMRAAGVPVELHLIDGVTHIFDMHAEFAGLAVHAIDLFLDRHVANPRRVPSTEPGARPASS